MVRLLVSRGADLEHRTDEMHTALMEACMDGHLEVARALVDQGARVAIAADSFESPLTLAACGGHVEMANMLVERRAALEERNDEGHTPLMEAAREGHEEMVALLLFHGAHVDARAQPHGHTALALACAAGARDVAKFLLEVKARRYSKRISSVVSRGYFFDFSGTYAGGRRGKKLPKKI